jgi:hypothetical protein
MKFAKIVFDWIGHQDPPPITHPGFYYGFVGLGLSWQFAFFIIGTDPARFRPMMIPSVLEKLGYGVAVVLLCLQRRMNQGDLVFGGVDLLFGLLFLIAFVKTALSA